MVLHRSTRSYDPGITWQEDIGSDNKVGLCRHQLQTLTESHHDIFHYRVVRTYNISPENSTEIEELGHNYTDMNIQTYVYK